MPRPLSPALRGVLERLHEHTTLLVRLFVDGAARGQALRHLLDHVKLEESENLVAARAIASKVPEAEKALHARVLDHIQLVLDMIAPDSEISPELARELLPHFAEEHLEYLGTGPAEEGRMTTSTAANDRNPLPDALREQLLQEITEEARRVLVGRKVLHVWGPLHPGLTQVKRVRFGRDEMARVDLYGREDDPDPIFAPMEETAPVPILYKDFIVHDREIALAAREGIPLDPTVAVRAAHWVCDSEDQLVFVGDQRFGIEGLLSAKDRGRVSISDWGKFGHAYKEVVQAIEKLLAKNHHGPFAMVTSPRLYHHLHRAHEGQPLEIDQLRKLCDHGVYRTPVLPDAVAVIVSVGKQNFDLAVTQDLDLSYVEARGMNHVFRVYEMMTLRIKRPEAICTLESGKRS